MEFHLTKMTDWLVKSLSITAVLFNHFLYPHCFVQIAPMVAIRRPQQTCCNGIEENKTVEIAEFWRGSLHKFGGSRANHEQTTKITEWATSQIQRENFGLWSAERNESFNSQQCMIHFCHRFLFTLPPTSPTVSLKCGLHLQHSNKTTIYHVCASFIV